MALTQNWKGEINMSEFRARLFKEQEELTIKTGKLSVFITSVNFNSLPEVDQEDLREQYKHMMEYLNVLNRRVNRQLG